MRVRNQRACAATTDGISTSTCSGTTCASPALHARLFFGMLARLPLLLWRKVAAIHTGHRWARAPSCSASGTAVLGPPVPGALAVPPLRVPVVLVHWLARSTLVRQASLQYLSRVQEATGALGRAPAARQPAPHVLLRGTCSTSCGRQWQVPLRAGPPLEGAGSSTTWRSWAGGGVIVTAHLGCLELCRAMAEEARRGEAPHPGAHPPQAGSTACSSGSIHSEFQLVEVTDLGPGTAVALESTWPPVSSW